MPRVPIEALSSLCAVMPDVRLRSRRVRDQGGMTLTELADATGISNSTLSRLEPGQCKPRLEVLVPIADAHQVPLDGLVGAGAVGDPRVRFVPGRGEVAEFDSAVPHWFSAAGDDRAELLSLLGRWGEPIHVRAAPRRRTPGG